jgi:membrane protein required for colicin V production
MTAFDFAVIAILLISLLLGLWRGFVHSVLSLMGWPVAYLLSKLFAGVVAPMMPLTQEAMRVAVAYVVLFIAGLIAWGVLVFMLSKLVKAIGLGGVDAFFGATIGLVRGAAAVVALVCLAGLTSIPQQPFWQQAKTSRMVEDFAQLVKTWMPDGMAQRIQFPPRS